MTERDRWRSVIARLVVARGWKLIEDVNIANIPWLSLASMPSIIAHVNAQLDRAFRVVERRGKRWSPYPWSPCE